MSDSPISAQHQGTFTAAGFVLALLALAFGLFTFRQVDALGAAVASLEMRDIKDDQSTVKKLTADMEALQKKVDALAAAAAAPPPAPPPATPAPTDAAAPPAGGEAPAKK